MKRAFLRHNGCLSVRVLNRLRQAAFPVFAARQSGHHSAALTFVIFGEEFQFVARVLARSPSDLGLPVRLSWRLGLREPF
ncbi:MAG: hypothetical protein AABW54_01825 [Candidatus Micrarchaeota archaeon]